MTRFCVHSQDAIKDKRQCVLTSKTRHSCRLPCSSFLFKCAASHRANLAFKTTIIEDAHLTLVGNPFKAEAKISLILFAITNIREKTCRVSVPVKIYNSLNDSFRALKPRLTIQIAGSKKSACGKRIHVFQT